MRRILGSGFLISTLLVAAACSSPGRTVSTFEGPAYEGPAFRKVLVIGVADNFNNRAAFERALSKNIAASGASATAIYTLVKPETPLDRPTVVNIVKDSHFDAVLISRVLSRDVDSTVKAGTSGARKVRRDGGGADLFRYDYEELNEPVTLTTELSAVIASELFSVASKEKVWSIETTSSKEASVGAIVLDVSESIAARLRKDGLIPK